MEKPFPSNLNKMVIVGFSSAMLPGQEPGVVRSPFSGAVFMSEPVTENIADHMTEALFERITKMEKYQLVPPSQARGVFTSLVNSDSISSDIEIYRKIGMAFSADAVLKGYIYRWREREGKDFAVDRPASVAFELYLIDPSSGAVLWKGRFDKTQQSLSENLLDMDTFVKGGGKWMTAEKLASVGLDHLLTKWQNGRN